MVDMETQLLKCQIEECLFHQRLLYLLLVLHENLPHMFVVRTYHYQMRIHTPLDYCSLQVGNRLYHKINLFPYIFSSLVSVLFHLLFLIDHNKSLISTSRIFAISTNVSKFGCMVLVHHLDTVPGSFPSCSANHLLVRFFSAKTTFKRFISLFILSMICI